MTDKKESFSIKDVLTRSKEPGKLKAKSCKVRLKAHIADENKYIFNATGTDKDSKRKGHEVIIVLSDQPDKQIADRDFKANCDCKSWVYYGSDYHARQNDYYEKKRKGLRGNGKFPGVRDPRKKNLICKHVRAALNTLIRSSRI